jgi:cell division septation protein DedD
VCLSLQGVRLKRNQHHLPFGGIQTWHRQQSWQRDALVSEARQKHGSFRVEVKKLLAATEPPKPDTPTTLGKLYRVQVGAYSIKANADAMLAKVKAAGFNDAFIKAE